MFASSSPPKVSRVRHGPRSRATTLTPRSVRTLAAAAPEAPAPMMQTSVRSGLRLAMGVLPAVLVALGEPGERAVAAGEHLVQRGGPGKADHPPADPVPVSAIDRIGVESLPGVHREERQEIELGLGAGLLQRRLRA